MVNNNSTRKRLSFEWLADKHGLEVVSRGTINTPYYQGKTLILYNKALGYRASIKYGNRKLGNSFIIEFDDSGKEPIYPMGYPRTFTVTDTVTLLDSIFKDIAIFSELNKGY